MIFYRPWSNRKQSESSQKAVQKTSLKGQPFSNLILIKKNSFFPSKNIVDMSFGCILLIRTDLDPLIDTRYTVQDNKAVKNPIKNRHLMWQFVSQLLTSTMITQLKNRIIVIFSFYTPWVTFQDMPKISAKIFSPSNYGNTLNSLKRSCDKWKLRNLEFFFLGLITILPVLRFSWDFRTR